MPAQSGTIEVTGADVEAAIARGLAQLRASREQVVIEVLDEGSRGLLGLGRRDAHVRLRLKVPQKPVAPTPPKETQKPAATAAPEPAPPAPVKQTSPAPVPVSAPKPSLPVTEVEGEEVAAVTDVEVTEQLQSEAEAGMEVWQTLLDKLNIDATIETHLSEPDDMTGRQVNIIDLHGRDLSILIGPRGETLDAMQYITRLMTAHQLKQRVNFVVDVEGFRERRTQALSRLAERMARKAVKRGRPVTLEPMSPSERRAVHMALRDYDGVYTESMGEGRGRRVRILLEK